MAGVIDSSLGVRVIGRAFVPVRTEAGGTFRANAMAESGLLTLADIAFDLVPVAVPARKRI